MQVMTVTGPVDLDQLGVTLTHEHIIMAFDWPGLWPEVSHRPDLVYQKVSLENLGELRRNYCAVYDNALLKDVDEMAREAAMFKNSGGSSIMEMSTYGLFGEPEKLREVSVLSGVKIIAGAGFYLDMTFSEEQRTMSVGRMYDVIMRDITEGFLGTDIRAGVIGEVGASSPMTPAEKRSFQASARAHRDTGLPINVHVGLDNKLCGEIIDIFNKEGVDLSKVVFAHCDGGSLERFKEVTSLGIYCELDCFGNEFYVDNGSYDGDHSWYFGSDGDRIRKVVELIDAGMADRIMLSQDVCSKMQTVNYGGYGYVNILDNIIPMLENAGVPRATVFGIMTDNVKRLYAGG